MAQLAGVHFVRAVGRVGVLGGVAGVGGGSGSGSGGRGFAVALLLGGDDRLQVGALPALLAGAAVGGLRDLLGLVDGRLFNVGAIHGAVARHARAGGGGCCEGAGLAGRWAAFRRCRHGGWRSSASDRRLECVKMQRQRCRQLREPAWHGAAAGAWDGARVGAVVVGVKRRDGRRGPGLRGARCTMLTARCSVLAARYSGCFGLRTAGESAGVERACSGWTGAGRCSR